MTNYVLYARKSSESEDRQVKSLDAQETEMLAIAEREGLTIVEIIRESHSAKTTNQRPEFNRMIKGIKRGTYNAILTWAPDRISRNAGDLGVVIDLMDAGKLECVKTYSQTFFNDPYSKFMFMMLGSQAKLEDDQRSLNVKRGNREKLKRGEWINLAPIGYLNDVATKKIVIDPIQAPYVVKMFELYSTGLYSFSQVADVLYNQGLRNRRGAKSLVVIFNASSTTRSTMALWNQPASCTTVSIHPSLPNNCLISVRIYPKINHVPEQKLKASCSLVSLLVKSVVVLLLLK